MYFVVVQQSVTLNCEAEGNPPPTYTWTPCDSKQVCDRNALDVSQVCEDVSYTCNVANGLGSDTKTANVCELLFSLTCLVLNSERLFALSLSHFKGKCDLMMIFFFFTVIEGEWIVIAINITDKSCADGKYNEFLLLDGFDKVVTTFMCLFTFSTLVKLKITFFWVCTCMPITFHVSGW